MALEKEIKQASTGVPVTFWEKSSQTIYYKNGEVDYIEVVQNGWFSKEDYVNGLDSIATQRYEIIPEANNKVRASVEEFHQEEILKKDEFKGAKDIGKVIKPDPANSIEVNK